MSVTQNSLFAYLEARQNLGNKQRAVFEALQELEIASNQQLSQHLKWPINCICPRVKELREKGFITKHGVVLDPKTNRMVTVWKLT